MASYERPVISLKQGKIRPAIEVNVLDGSNFLAFRGIPYAKPPIGELRFKDPLPAEGWSGVRDGSKFGDVCAHRDILTREIIGSDDCLYLNIYTTRTDPAVKLPVMVWIHGGGFYLGSGNDNMHGPDYLVRKDIVFVTFNYRLGVLGFLNLEDEVAPGNQGLKDQVMALRWIRDNIDAFGGDPENVTIFGGSAGGASVHYLTISPLADGLFHKAIAQSGVAVNPWANLLKEPRRYGYQLSSNLGFKSFDPKAVVDFLRTVDARKLVEFQGRLKTVEEDLTMISVFCPGVDYKSANPFLTQPPSIAMKQGTKVPLLMGNNEMEGSMFVSDNIMEFKSYTFDEKIEKLNNHFEAFLPDSILDELKEKNISTQDLKRLYFGEGTITKDAIENYANLVGDIFFVHGIYEALAATIPKSKAPIYLYKFAYDNSQVFIKTFLNIKLPGATHSEEMVYMFYARLMQALNIEPHQPGTTPYKVMEYITEMWINFAKTGNPTPAKTDLISVLWEPVNGNSDKYSRMVIDEELKMEYLPKGQQRFEWNLNKKNKL